MAGVRLETSPFHFITLPLDSYHQKVVYYHTAIARMCAKRG